MNSLIADTESSVRLAIFLCVFLVLAVAELRYPRRALAYSKLQRWLSNIGISVLNTYLVRILLPVAGVSAALLAQEQQWGILNQIQLVPWLGILIFVAVFDLTIYWQHRLFHVVPLLWRFHRMHHTDMDYDLTTGNRFHPISILISSAIKLSLVLLMGPSPISVLIAEVLLNVTSMFNHSNLKLPLKMDSLLRKLIVTPDMHRIHHSTDELEHNHNFGFNFSWWDRLFNSYLDQASEAQEKLDIGIAGMQDKESLGIFAMLLQPFKSPSITSDR
jgi:sterol desaturase/sphingolipid hydroxylase (fatty acid hydroxylase superfamily)